MKVIGRSFIHKKGVSIVIDYRLEKCGIEGLEFDVVGVD
jgi:hypothetical protein